MILGSGLHTLCDRIDPIATVDYADIPELPATTVAGHPGCMTLGMWVGVRVLVFAGRPHRYEGHRPEAIVRPVQIARELGARTFLATNSAGGIASSLAPPCLLAVTDHLDLTKPSSWRDLATRPPARSSPYSPLLLDMAQRAARDLGTPLGQGMYAQVTGPNYETPAEVRALAVLGAAVVGMSTAAEIETARALGLECAAVSAVTNHAAGLGETPLNHEEVIVNAAFLADSMSQLLEGVLRRMK